jgi:putative tricarboxylic transport membrane protein
VALIKSGIITGVVVLITGSVIACEAHRIPPGIGDDFGPGAFPMALGVIIAICGAGMMAGAVFKPAPAGEVELARWPITCASLLLLFSYTFALAWLGFLPATAVLVPCLLWLLGMRPGARMLMAAVAIPAAIYLLFDLLLGVQLPAGVLLGS